MRCHSRKIDPPPKIHEVSAAAAAVLWLTLEVAWDDISQKSGKYLKWIVLVAVKLLGHYRMGRVANL